MLVYVRKQFMDNLILLFVVTSLMVGANAASLTLFQLSKQFFQLVPGVELYYFAIWLPFGVKFFIIWLYRVKGLALLLPTAILSGIIYGGALPNDNSIQSGAIMISSLIVSMSIFLILEYARRQDIPVFSRNGKRPDPLSFLLCASISSALANSIFASTNFFGIFGPLWPIVWCQRVVSDILGLIVVIVVLGFVSRSVRRA